MSEQKKPDKITHYTDHEGGEWQRWPGLVNAVPAVLFAKGHQTQTLHNVTLYAFRTARGREWDTINGWRDQVNNNPPTEVAPEPAKLKTFFGTFTLSAVPDESIVVAAVALTLEAATSNILAYLASRNVVVEEPHTLKLKEIGCDVESVKELYSNGG